MSGRHRLAVAAILLAAVLAILALVVFAHRACPADTPAQPCPTAPLNRAVVIALAAAAAGLLVAPFAFLGEVLARRRIVYRGAWLRAGRRGAIVAAVLAVLAALRLGGALSVPIAFFVVVLAATAEWLLGRRDA